MQERLYLLGHPVAHSKSPAMHNALYRALGIPWDYEAKDCAEAAAARRFLEEGDFLGVNITTPYKPLAFEHATIKAASAKLAQGANVLVRKGAASIAYNKDGEGCVSYLEQKGFSFKGAKVVVCGTGPTSLAILFAAAVAGAAKVVLIGRNKQRAERVLKGRVKEFDTMAWATIELPAAREGHRSFREAYEKTELAFGSYRTSSGVFADADLIVNATPQGMGEGDAPPFDTSLLQEHQTVYDVVYGHGQTSLVKAAQEAGCTVFDGSGMLVAQAVASAITFFEIAGIDIHATEDEMFTIMAKAANFLC